ncbi:hypothetical protein IAE35_12790 [Pseudomonas sp. S75]|uniref:hypothetical protein n=1 Tax=unclassified Pseudomonas TaxID=196821 RepID=UPI0019053B11|nr:MULTISPECIES: hypothetical protein [unclassified Pseudomonas]MBJ9974473.1 hypothetical protein [Pseudomonas sp. S30]MBK0154218.1 hypothetical protein [Pseudomonas sp. S75]
MGPQLDPVDSLRRAWGNHGNSLLLAICLMLASSSGQATPGDTSAAPQLPVSAPFALDAAGSSIAIPFEVTDRVVDARRYLMIGVDVPHAGDFPAVDDVRLHVRLLRVRVVYDEGGVQVPIETEDTDTIIARNSGKPSPRADPTVCRLHLYAAIDEESNLSVCGFHARRNGHYIAEISTIEPMPAFKGVATTVRVDNYYNTGE